MSGPLVRKLLVAAGAPAVAVLGLFGVLAHEVARRSLEDELGRRLATAAAGAALLVLPGPIDAIGAGDEGSATYANLRKSLGRAKELLGGRRGGRGGRAPPRPAHPPSPGAGGRPAPPPG